MMVQILQHVPFEGPGSIERWLFEQKANVQYTHFFELSASLPDPGAVDLVIVMGGPMSVNDEQKHPWLKREKKFIREIVDLGIPIVGVCLGGQLIASALDAQVYNNTEKEIGWFPVDTEETDQDVFQFPQKMMPFHWHGETFDLPSGAVRLASNTICQNQAFQIGRKVIGLQFHLEITPETLDLLIENGRDELVDGTHIQTEQQMRSVRDSVYDEINNLIGSLLDYVTKKPL
jgi:GMP synthase-like glutamine amidotransferase